MTITEFDIGNVYSTTDDEDEEKTYYVAVSKLTLVTCENKTFGEFTTKKSKRHEYESISVEDLCFLWDIETSALDEFMVRYFAPDEQAIRDSRKRAKQDGSEELELSSAL